MQLNLGNMLRKMNQTYWIVLLLLILLSFGCGNVTAQSQQQVSPVPCRSSAQGLELSLGPVPFLPSCPACPSGSTLSSSGCTCAFHSVASASTGTCTACSSNEMTLPSLSQCIPCPSTATYNSTSQTCECPQFQRIVLSPVSSTNSAVRAQCMQCPTGTYPSSDQLSCLPCPDSTMTPTYVSTTSPPSYTCSCRQTSTASKDNASCLPQSYVTTMQAVYANHEILSVNVSAATSGVVNQQLISSPLLAATFLPSLYQCSQGNPAPQGVSPTACQRVANLCALVYGDPAHPICIAYLTSLLAQAPPSSLPAKDSRVTLGSAYSTTGAINVTIASYWLNGTIDSVQPWASWLSGVCGDVASSITSTSSSNPLSLIAGVGSMARCSLSKAKSANRIFEAYLIDLTGYHWPIPIFVAKGSRTRRFFLYDDATLTTFPSVTRIATSVALSFPMLGAESYGLPHISITHKESALSTITPTFAPLVTTVEYVLDTHSFWDMFHIGAPVASVMVGAIWLARVSSPSRQHVNLADPWSAIQMLDLLLEMIAPGTALATGVIMVYVWVFYTFQGGAAGGKWFMWLPGPLDEKSFRDAVLAALVLQAVHVAVVLYAQLVHTRVYLIDWEKPVKDGSPVSTWRAVHAGRKYIETAGYARSIAGWACLLAALVPIKSDSWFLACAEHTLVILGLWCGIYMLRTLLIEPYFSNPPMEFVDFLSIVNISVLILAPNSDPCAYYLHGRSVFPVTDTDMSTVQANLKREATDAVSRRGLTNTDDVLFTVKPSIGLVKALDTIENVFAADMLSNPLGSPTSPTQTGGGQDTDPLLLPGAARSGMHARRQLPPIQVSMLGLASGAAAGQLSISANARRHTTLHTFLSRWIDQTLKEQQYEVITRPFLDRLFDTFPQAKPNTSIFAGESEPVFLDCMWAGMETQVLILTLLAYNLTLMAYGSVSSVSPALVGFFTYSGLQWARRALCVQFVARSTGLDSRIIA